MVTGLKLEQAELRCAISLEAVVAVEMVGADIEKHRYIAVEAVCEVNLVGGEFEHVDAAFRQRLLAEDRKSYIDRKSTRLNSSHLVISYAVFCLKKIKKY